jgi:hypothetical protein
MKKETRLLVEREIKRLAIATERAGKVTDVSRKEIEEIAKRYAKESSSVLAAIIGAATGAAGGITVSGIFGTALVSGPLGMLVGAALAIMSWRGIGYLQLERAEERLDKALLILKRELNYFPQDAPPEIKERLWRDYNELLSIYSSVAKQSLSGLVTEKFTVAKLPSVIEGEVAKSGDSRSSGGKVVSTLYSESRRTDA